MTDLPDQIGPYRVEREIGRGGMGVVFLGWDDRLHRHVAIKSLPIELATDPDRLARFEREAKTLASLNHPGIAGIHGIEQQEGRKYLILEYVEGETLGDRLDRGPIPLDEALEIAVGIASGMEAAHDAGVIHRDLKPDNVKVTADGKVKVLDFGLARTEEASSASSQSGLSDALTRSRSPTVPGQIMGTAAYMSPEQARGRAVDRRSDIWSFGVILYEMLTGVGPFAGETLGDSIGAVLHRDVDLDRLPPGTPATIRNVLRRSLRRDRNERCRDIGDARLELQDRSLDDESPVPGAAGRATAAARRSGRRAGFAVGAVVGIVVGAAVTWPVLRRADTPPGSARSDAPRRFSITLPDWAPVAPPSKYPFGIALRMISLSPDGGMLVYTALVDGKLQLCLRDMATGEVQSVPGGEGGFGAVFSPDGRELAFFARERLLKLDLERRTAPELIADTSAPGGIDWASDGTIYFSPAENKPILAVAASGGAARPVTVQSAPGESHILPYLSADERMLMYTDYRGVVRVSATPLDGSQPARMLVEYGSDGRYVESGHVIFLREDRLMALPVRAATLEALGIPATIVSGVRSNWECGHFSLARDGTLVYMAGVPGDVARFVLVDRSGASEDPGLPLDRYVAFSLSPDGRRLATPVIEGADVDIWLYDLERVGTPARITFGGVHNHTCWSSDGRYLLFTRLAADGTSAVLAKDLESGAAAIEIMPRTSPTIPLDLDEKSGELLFSASTTDGAMDVMRGVVDLSAGAEVQVERIETLSATPYNEPFAAISPDRKWIVANSDETGRWELFLSSYPDFASRVQLSTHGGEEPRWTKDGGRVVYRWNDEWFEVEVTTEPSLVVGSPRRIASGPYINVPGYSWDMSRDADRLLLLEGPQQDTPATEIQVITGFIEELRRAAPPDRDG